ncbi:hypothetical protein [Streptomyces lydicus]|uniref:hypothetical protein n=1 Tax=Streptomyces lydicus TaxID=47763 RepID=UPI0037986991
MSRLESGWGAGRTLLGDATHLMPPRTIDNAEAAQEMLGVLMPDDDSDGAVFPDTLRPAGTRPAQLPTGP